MPRRSFALLSSLALVAFACTGSADPTTTTTAATTTTRPPTTTTTAPTTTTTAATTTTLPEAYGGSVTVGLSTEPPTLNPLLSDDPSVRLIAQAWTVGVQEVSGETGELVPEVVVELPSVANGGVVVNGDGTMTVTYEIRDEAVWSDGTPITGTDFQFTLETILDPAISVPKDVYGDIISFGVADKTFTYTMAFPTIAFESLFDVLLPQHQMAGSDFANDWNDRAWLSGGPFVFDSWTPGNSITFSRNPAYWKVDGASELSLPYLDEVTFQVIQDATSRFEALAGRALDATLADAPEIDGQLSVLGALGAAVDTKPGPVWVHVNFQFGDGRWDRNPDSLNEILAYRQAMMHAIDRDRIASELFGDQAIPLDSYVDVYNPSLSQDAWSQYEFDPVRASSLFAEAVATRRAEDPEAVDDVIVFFTTNASNEARTQVSELIEAMLLEMGIAYVDTSENSLTFFGETVGSGRYDVGMWAWQAAPGHAALVSFHDVLDPADTRAVTNFYRWGTEDSAIQDGWTRRYEQLVEMMRETPDHDKLDSLIREAEQLVADQAVFLPLYAEPVSAVYWPDVIEGFVMNPTTGFTWNIEQWRSPKS